MPTLPTSAIRRRLLCALLGASGPATAADAPWQMDWVRHSSLPPELRGERAAHCGGAYVDPLAGVDASEAPGGQPLHADADESRMRGAALRFRGDVRLRQGYRRLGAERIDYDSQSGEGALEGDVAFREPGIHLRGERAWFDSRTGEARLSQGAYLAHERRIRGAADEIRRRADGVMELDQARYSHCPPGSEDWQLRAAELELDLKSGIGAARRARIAIAQVPVLYLPYLQFPIGERRKSGFLWPTLGGDSSGGIDLAAPYYLDLAPNYDLTLTPRWMADRGAPGALRARYLGPRLGAWELGGSYLERDDEYRREFPGRDASRWLARASQRGLVANRWRTHVDYTRVSDPDYFGDIGTADLNARQSTHLSQRAQLDYLGDNWLASARFERFQTLAGDLASEPYRKLPALSLERAAPARDFRLNLQYAGEFADFEHASLPGGRRLYNSLGVTYPMSWVFGFLEGSAGYRHIHYRLDNDIAAAGRTGDSPDFGAPTASLDGGLFFEREMAWGEAPLVQTLEPRLYYLWSDFEAQDGLPVFDTGALLFGYGQLFRARRFSGRDRLADANQLAIGVTTRVIDRASGAQRLHASIGQIRYFEDRRVTLGEAGAARRRDSSAIAAELGFAPRPGLAFSSSLLYDSHAAEVDETHLRLAWTTSRDQMFNLGYNWRRHEGLEPRFRDINQFELSAALPLGGNWAVFLQTLYDLDENDSINDLFGLEYDDCCWRARLAQVRSLNQRLGPAPGVAAGGAVETRRAVYLEFQLKGLGGVGTRLAGILEEFIRGYHGDD